MNTKLKAGISSCLLFPMFTRDDVIVLVLFLVSTYGIPYHNPPISPTDGTSYLTHPFPE